MKTELIKQHMQLGELTDIPAVTQFFDSDPSFFWKTEYVSLLFKSFHMTLIEDSDKYEQKIASQHYEHINEFMVQLWCDISWFHTKIILKEFCNLK